MRCTVLALSVILTGGLIFSTVSATSPNPVWIPGSPWFQANLAVDSKPHIGDVNISVAQAASDGLDPGSDNALIIENAGATPLFIDVGEASTQITSHTTRYTRTAVFHAHSSPRTVS